jgi:hypothetical protein
LEFRHRLRGAIVALGTATLNHFSVNFGGAVIGVDKFAAVNANEVDGLA